MPCEDALFVSEIWCGRKGENNVVPFNDLEEGVWNIPEWLFCFNDRAGVFGECSSYI
jgi:hypothetical protein